MPAPKTASPSIESTVSSPSCGMGSSLLASNERPKKQAARMIPIIVMVAAAFLASGLRKAGTPSATASTPESATAPEENARMRANTVMPVMRVPLLVISASASSWPAIGPRSSNHTW